MEIGRFARVYLRALAAAAYIFSVGWTRRRNRVILLELANSVAMAPLEPRVPAVDVADLVDPAHTYTLREIFRGPANVTADELAIITALVGAANPRVVLEIGTDDGRTTLNLALNAPRATVYTLDLPPAERRFAPDQDPVGRRFRGTELAARIVQLYGDSATVDLSELHGAVDFAFIDGSHEYGAVLSDSRRVVDGLASDGPGAPTVVWHDYGRWEGVTRALDELFLTDVRFAELRWVRGTSLMVLRRATIASETGAPPLITSS